MTTTACEAQSLSLSQRVLALSQLLCLSELAQRIQSTTHLIHSAKTPSTLYRVSHTRSVTLPYTSEKAFPGCPPAFPGAASFTTPAECSALLAARQGA